MAKLRHHLATLNFRVLNGNFSLCRPTFKTAVPTSRTQLKQQLQREQLQELERREAEKRGQQTKTVENSYNMPVKVPLQVDVVDVPPQVLQVHTTLIVFLLDITCLFLTQVKTKLENPTRYHVIQKQKTQVRQYLSESFSQSHMPHRQTNSLGASLLATQHALRSPQPQPEIKSHSLEYMQYNNNNNNNSTPTPSSGQQQFYFPNHSRLNSVTASPSEGAMSPSISSVVTSGSEVRVILIY